ncbi:MAG: chemotaxis protein CheV [Porticoccaceae bacterium]|nr:MAG: chemotaxis protein CheV [Porticoccaceae bacterium]
MANLLESVNQRTQLAGQNRVELLLFRLNGDQLFGINVFKVTEVTLCPPLTRVPNSHEVVRGIAQLRGKIIPMLDLAHAVGDAPVADISVCYAIITEYNRHTQGFLVSGVDRIVNVPWEEMSPPPAGSALNSYLTAVTHIGSQLVQIIDVEKVMAEVHDQNLNISDKVRAESQGLETRPILVVDDSSVARNQIQRTLEQIGLRSVQTNNGKEALGLLEKWAAEGPLAERISMVISDIEMPEMDGYTLTTEIRNNPALAELYVLLHTSLSGIFNNALVAKVGANHFLAKFDPDDLAVAVGEALKQVGANPALSAEDQV